MFILGDNSSAQLCAEHQHPWGREPPKFSFGLVCSSLAHGQPPVSHSTGRERGFLSQVIPCGRHQEAAGAAPSALAPSCVLDVSGFPLAAPGVCGHRPGAALSPAHASGTFRASPSALPFPPAQTQPPAPPQGTATRSFPCPFPGSPPALTVTDASKHDATSPEPCTFRP